MTNIADVKNLAKKGRFFVSPKNEKFVKNGKFSFFVGNHKPNQPGRLLMDAKILEASKSDALETNGMQIVRET